MANRNTHIIAKHFLHLVFPEKEGHFQRQDRISKVYWEKLVRKMGELFDRYVGPDEIIRLDSLQIDLGHITWKKFDDEFVKRALEQLELSLIQLLKVKVDESQISAVPFRQNRFQQWLFFLEKGAFDWRVSIHEEADFHRAVLDTLGMESAAITQLSNLLNRNNKAFDRLIFQHEDSFLKTLVELYTGIKQEQLPIIFSEIRQILDKIDPPPGKLLVFLRSRSSQSFRLHFWKKILTISILERQRHKGQELVIAWLKTLVRENDWPVLARKIQEELELKKGGMPQLRKVVAVLPPAPSPIVDPITEEQKQRPFPKESPEEGKVDEKRPLEVETGFEQTQHPEEIEFSKDGPVTEKEKEISDPKTKSIEQAEVELPANKATKEAPSPIDPSQPGQKIEPLATDEISPPEEMDDEAQPPAEKAQEPGAIEAESTLPASEKSREAGPSEQSKQKAAEAEVLSTEIEEQEVDSSKPMDTADETSSPPAQELMEKTSPPQTVKKAENLIEKESKGLPLEEQGISPTIPLPDQDQAPPKMEELSTEITEAGTIEEAEKTVNPKDSTINENLAPKEETEVTQTNEQTPETTHPKLPEKEENIPGELAGLDPAKQEKNTEKKRKDQQIPTSRKPPDQLDKESGRRYKPIEDQPVGTSFYVFNAGVVLMHPFLSHFFRALQLVRVDEFVNDEAQQKAIHLIQYLATREMGLPEYELLLPKLLCSLPFDIPIEREVEISSEEMNEAEELLEAVIQHWGALGTSSPDALREGFLQRQGKLEKREHGWYLQVEQKTIDILLGKLPWGLGMIKLPWMPEILRVEWA